MAGAWSRTKIVIIVAVLPNFGAGCAIRVIEAGGCRNIDDIEARDIAGAIGRSPARGYAECSRY